MEIAVTTNDTQGLWHINFVAWFGGISIPINFSNTLGYLNTLVAFCSAGSEAVEIWTAAASIALV